ncbi:alkaline phosphatase D family protein [Streptomyces sp. NPDC002055]|uniref:alkaline phosphatase D family protein n=1 Tax=Streptomyces sp. NPDC002055 TaxID=3154534 RepID=UPI003321E701
MAGLLLGPLLRYVDEHSATVWIETSRPCDAEVVCDGGSGGGAARTWQVAGHHYALITVIGLEPGTSTPYRVRLDGQEVWPPPEDTRPPSTITTLPAGADGPLRISFGSCRWAAPPHGGAAARAAGRAVRHDPVGPDALDLLATRLAGEPDAERPDVLLLLGDQVYADETSPAMRQWIATRRDLKEPPGSQVADFEEYTRLYYESWLDPSVRWLLSTVPSCAVFDDHDVIDDWNTSAAWREKMQAAPWWQERILAGFMSYWVYQHLGNLSPTALAADPLFTQVRTAADGTDLVREFAARADADPGHTRWSYRRDFGRTRLLMVDTRAGRVLEESRRAMVDPDEWAWVRDQVTAGGPGAYDHLLIGTSLPWLLPPAIHDAERWNAALCAGERGRRWARIAESLRQAGDLEHWAAFPSSFDAFTELVAEAGSGRSAPATVCVLSGDVHHAYVAEPRWPGGAERPGGAESPGEPGGAQQAGDTSQPGDAQQAGGVRQAGDAQGPGSAQRAGGFVPQARILQLTCSPVHNSVPASMKLGFRFGWSRAGRWVGRALARHARAAEPAIGWDRTGGPWFGNQLMTLTIRGRTSSLRLEQARQESDGRTWLEQAAESEVSGPGQERAHPTRRP